MQTELKVKNLSYDDIKLLYTNFYKNNFKYVLDQKFIYNKQNKKYNIIIGVKDRTKYLHTTLNFLKNSIKYSSNPDEYNIIVCEHDYRPKHKLYCLNNKIDYGFLNLKNSNTNDLYSRGLVFNCSVKAFPSSEWYLFHDCDLLTPNLFFKNLESLIVNCKSWIQPYSNKMVLNLSTKDTELLQNNSNNLIPDLDKEYYSKTTKNMPGAVGGSTLVPKTLFYEVGGFDSELFYGYAPEDALFWFKLECLYKKIEFHKHWNNHFGSAEYAENNNLYHQAHLIEINKNLEHDKMVNIKNNYVNLSYDEIKKLIKIKKEYFLNA